MRRCQVGAESFQADRHDAGNSCRVIPSGQTWCR